MFKQLLVLSLTVCLIGCSGKDKSEKTGQQSNQLSQKVRPVSATVPGTYTSLQQLDNSLVQAAPDNCIVFATWSGYRSKAGSNPADKLLTNSEFAEPIEKFASFLSVLPFAAKGAKERDSSNQVNEFVLIRSLKQSPEMMKMLSSTPGCAYFGISGGLDAAIVFKAGEQADSFNQHLQDGFSPFGQPVETVEVRGEAFSKITVEFEGNPLELVLGASNGHFIIGLGAQSVEGVLTRMAAGKNPAWHASSRLATAPDPEQTEYLMVNVAQIMQLVGGLPTELESMNLQELNTVEMVTGRTEQGVLHRLIVNGGQKITGLDGYKQVDFSKFGYIPDDAQVAMVFGLEPEKVYISFMRQLEKADEWAYRDFTEGEQALQRELGINLRKDILANLGSNLSFHIALNDDLLGGMVASIDIKNKVALENVIDKMLAIVRKQIDRGEYWGPKFRLWKVGEHNVGSFIDRYFVVEPCWCITGDRLIVTLSPEAMRTSLAPPTTKPLFGAEIPKMFNSPAGNSGAANEQLVSATYVDMKTTAQVVYPMVRAAFTGFKSNIEREFGDDIVGRSFQKMLMNVELPPLRTIVNELGPATLAIRINETGFEYEFSHTLPVLNPVGTLATGFACALPIISNNEGNSARKQNDIRQIGLACLNYESTFGQLPTDIVDGDGKPLLSWRVRILPFMEQTNLHNLIHVDEPWDSEHNSKFLKNVPEIYRTAGVGEGMTTIRGVGGDQGLFGLGNKGIGFGDIIDGSSNTILTVDASQEFAVEWLKPGPLDAEAVDIDKLFGQRGGMTAGFCDGSVQRLSKRVGSDKLRAFFTRSGGEDVNIRYEMRQNREASPLAAALMKALEETNVKIFGPVEVLRAPSRRGRGRFGRVRAMEAKEAVRDVGDWEVEEVAPIERIELEIERIELEMKKEAFEKMLEPAGSARK